MPRYVFVRGGQVREVRSYEPALDLAEVKVHPIDGLMLRPIVSIIDPPFDPDAQVRTGPTYTLRDAEADEVFTVRPMTRAELDAVAARKAAEQQRKDRVKSPPRSPTNGLPAAEAKIDALAGELDDVKAFLREEFGLDPAAAARRGL